MPCPLTAFGCGVRPERRALAAHTAEAALRHVELLAAHATAQAAQVAVQALRLEQVDALNAALSARVAHLEQRGSSAAGPAAGGRPREQGGLSRGGRLAGGWSVSPCPLFHWRSDLRVSWQG